MFSNKGLSNLPRPTAKVSCKKKLKTFQIQEALIGSGEDMTRLCDVYRPPYTGKARFTAAQFLEEFSDYLTDLQLKPGHPLLMSDFNFQVQDKDNFYAGKLLSLRDSMGFNQLVPITPTHYRGLTLDLVLCQKERVGVVKNVDVFPDRTSSDHSLVLAWLRCHPSDSV